MSEYTIETMTEQDLPTVVELENEAFNVTFKQLMGAIPPGRQEGVRVANRFFRPDTVSIVLKDEERRIQGVEFVKMMGTRGVVGPGAIRPGYRGKRAGSAVAAAVVERGRQQGCPVIDSVTFPSSPLHFVWHWQFGAVSVPAVFMVRDLAKAPATGGSAQGLKVERFSELNEARRTEALGAARQVTERFFLGFHLTADIQHVHQRKLGETLLIHEGSRLLGLAICHYGPGSEAFLDEQLLIQHLYVSPGEPRGADAFNALLGRVEELATAMKLQSVAAMALSNRRVTVDAMMERNYNVTQIHQHWVTTGGLDLLPILTADASTYRADQFALSELR